MAHFLLQKDKDTLEIEEAIIEDLLKRNKYSHEYDIVTLKELDKITEGNLIPVGTIQFVTKYLKEHYGIESEVPVEIPKYLQIEEFLKRDYKIVTWDKVPKTGKFFLKDVSVLKEYGMVTQADYLDMYELFNYKPVNKIDSTLVLSKEHNYQVSSLLNIKAEYRVYVIDNEIQAITNYEGSPLNIPDTKLLQKAVMMIQANEKWLTSYTIDIAVGNFGTAILEIHNFTSVGLYHALWGSDLLYAYISGINYLKNDNTVKYL